jgi:hypothetical protein
MGFVLLDTTVLIDVLRGRPDASSRLAALRHQGDRPCTCVINAEEVARGLRANEEAAAHRLFAGLRLAPLGTEEGWRAGTWRREHAKEGKTLTQADCLIAAAAAGIGARLATGNPKHFPMSGLTVEHWPTGH